MLTHDEATSYHLEMNKRLARLRAVYADRGLPCDWLETVCHHGRIFRDWHPCRLGARRRYGLEARQVWDARDNRFVNSIALRFVVYPGKGFRTMREAAEVAARINAALEPFPLVEEVKVAALTQERSAVHDARQRAIAARRAAMAAAA